ncbi:hypothetical protein ACJX0J_010335, partial [Zea mays]
TRSIATRCNHHAKSMKCFKTTRSIATRCNHHAKSIEMVNRFCYFEASICVYLYPLYVLFFEYVELFGFNIEKDNIKSTFSKILTKILAKIYKVNSIVGNSHIILGSVTDRIVHLIMQFTRQPGPSPQAVVVNFWMIGSDEGLELIATYSLFGMNGILFTQGKISDTLLLSLSLISTSTCNQFPVEFFLGGGGGGGDRKGVGQVLAENNRWLLIVQESHKSQII